MAEQLIDCGGHGKRPWYIVCKHVMDDGAKPDHIILAQPGAAGEILCATCHEKPDIKNTRGICDRCADERILSKWEFEHAPDTTKALGDMTDSELNRLMVFYLFRVPQFVKQQILEGVDAIVFRLSAKGCEVSLGEGKPGPKVKIVFWQQEPKPFNVTAMLPYAPIRMMILDSMTDQKLTDASPEERLRRAAGAVPLN